MQNLVLVAQVMSAHGLKGAFKLRTFTQEPIQDYVPLLTNNGDSFLFDLLQDLGNGTYLAQSKTILNRTDAEKIKGLKLYIEKDRLPKTDSDEFYHIDLVECEVYVGDQLIGCVNAVHDFGAGTFLDVKTDGKTATIPFNKEAILDVNLADKKIIAHPDFLFI